MMCSCQQNLCDSVPQSRVPRAGCRAMSDLLRAPIAGIPGSNVEKSIATVVLRAMSKPRMSSLRNSAHQVHRRDCSSSLDAIDWSVRIVSTLARWKPASETLSTKEPTG